MKYYKFFLLLLLLQKISCEESFNFTDHLKQQIQSNILNDKGQSFSFYNKTIEGNIPQLYDSALADSPELIAHQNRVFKCSDHPQVAESVCRQSDDPCFCSEHESYTYSFCRKSCGYCSEEETTPREFWRVRTLISSPTPFSIKSILFYHSPIDRDEVTTLHKIKSNSKRDKKPSDPGPTIWSNGWFENKVHGHDAKNDSFVGYNFGYPIVVDSIKAVFGKKNKHTIFVVEASSHKSGPFMKRWIFRTFKKPSDNTYYKRNCPVLWKKYETAYKSFCVKLVANFTTWADASKHCKMEDAELASIMDENENDFIEKIVRPCGTVWIGYNDIENEGKYVWSDNEKGPDVYENWQHRSKKSVEQKKSEDCTTIDSDGTWSTDLCSNSHYYLCKKTTEDMPTSELDMGNINLDPPQLFFADDISRPFLNTTETNERRLKEDVYFDIRLTNNLPHKSTP